MKKIYILVPVLVMSFLFARMSSKHPSNISPSGLSFSGQKAELSSKFDASDDTSVKWKRRHKKRKKTRRPQRGR